MPWWYGLSPACSYAAIDCSFTAKPSRFIRNGVDDASSSGTRGRAGGEVGSTFVMLMTERVARTSVGLL